MENIIYVDTNDNILTSRRGGGGAKIWPNYMLGEKMNERGGNAYFFPHFDLKLTLNGAHPLIITNLFGENISIKKGGRGQKYEFQI